LQSAAICVILRPLRISDLQARADEGRRVRIRRTASVIDVAFGVIVGAAIGAIAPSLIDA
jgi:hypothetical protein